MLNALKGKLVTGSIYSAPIGGGTLTGYIAYRLGVPLDVVILGATAIAQGLQAIASRFNRRRKSKASAPRA